MPGLILAVAGLFECGWAVALKASHGMTRPVPAALTVVLMAVSLWLLGLAMRAIPVGTAYAVWTGIGATGVALVGMFWFGESRAIARLACIFLIIVGVIGLRLFAGRPAA